MTDTLDSLKWDSNIDTLLAGWCDNAKCFEWMHTEAHALYEKRSKAFMITSNCVAALAGVSNVITGGLTIDGFQVAWFFGGLSILVSTMNIIQDKLGYQQRSVIHNKLAGEWSVIISKIEEIISIPYNSRRDCKTFLKFIKADINSANLEGNSMIPTHIRKLCYDKFKSIDGFDIPDICGHVEHTKIFVNIKEPLIN